MIRIRAAARRKATLALAVGVFGLIAPGRAHAFRLVAPVPWLVEGQDGDPQAVAPCGTNASVCYEPTGAVTTFTAGQEITLDWIETAPSDGWFRIALSYNDRTDLSDPAVVVDDAGFATDASISPPTDPDAAPLGITTSALPVLADGLFPHVAADIPGVPYRYTWNLMLPDKPCERCTLQVTQFLATKSSGGYFAHHCADITILPAVDMDAATDPRGSLAVLDDAGGPSAACAVADGGAGGETSLPDGTAAAIGIDGAQSPAGDAGGAPVADAAHAVGNGGGGCECGAIPVESSSLLGTGSLLALAARRRRGHRSAR